jgi:hypothetical protein
VCVWLGGRRMVYSKQKAMMRWKLCAWVLTPQCLFRNRQVGSPKKNKNVVSNCQNATVYTHTHIHTHTHTNIQLDTFSFTMRVDANAIGQILCVYSRTVLPLVRLQKKGRYKNKIHTAHTDEDTDT